jgi:predicted ArsR family transcriptional regulator
MLSMPISPDDAFEGVEATPEELKALSHPLRLRILRLCLHDALTNKQIADELEKDPATTLHHVRMLVATGFLAAQEVRAGNRGALEKPYLATRKSWTMRVSKPEDKVQEMSAMIDALRDEVVAAGPDATVEGARIGLKLSAKRAKAFERRLRKLIADVGEGGDDPDGDEYGFFVVFHRR